MGLLRLAATGAAGYAIYRWFQQSQVGQSEFDGGDQPIKARPIGAPNIESPIEDQIPVSGPGGQPAIA